MKQLELTYIGASNRKALVDITWNERDEKVPLVLFVHGFKGFKDWGTFPLVAQYFAAKGFVFAKMNFSHNGTTPDDPLNFADLEAFGQNRFSYELTDIGRVAELLPQTPDLTEVWDGEHIYLLGHSRGGATALMYAGEHAHIQKVATWASVADFSSRYTTEQLAYWEKEGVIYIPNARTNQEMPLQYSLVTDYFEHQPQMNVEQQVKALHQSGTPQLIVHGTTDETVHVNDAKLLQSWNPNAELMILDQANHTFGAAHPWNSNELPADMQLVVTDTMRFFLN